MLPKLSFILGGAASGKSAYAESLFAVHAGTRTYLATAQSFDSEMENKISRHQIMRGEGWDTIERPMDIAPVFLEAQPESAILFDCATLWLSNLLLADRNVEEALENLLFALNSCAIPVVIVSNEVGAGIVPAEALSRRFREAQGRLNQQLAAQSDYAVLVVAGLPLTLKGTMPEAT
ncbi:MULTISPECIES: bifunctional adenosylcobinamide kinase/adenosylcobinamide-phosphate guanylyltransferase [Falsihalocynthiibacter]|uniref:bifunctional adenosylcobinamide kinase/adenosylcobinamide-phosphate guanylyltransferase n=1 Tax=Falsihalocynthiibacter TaxID=2854182 RepID=UPI0030019539